jgi:hypothetical protein
MPSVSVNLKKKFGRPEPRTWEELPAAIYNKARANDGGSTKTAKIKSFS